MRANSVQHNVMIITVRIFSEPGFLFVISKLGIQDMNWWVYTI